MNGRLLVAAAVLGSVALSCTDTPGTPTPTPSPAPPARPAQLSDRDFIKLYMAAGLRTPRRLRSPGRHSTRRPGDPTVGQLRVLRWCESGRDDSAGVDSDERARGLYKFMRETWASVGGHGDPAAASYAEQTMRTVMLYRREGWTPWLASSTCTGLR